MEAPLTESNSLPELAARIRAEHTAVAAALKDSLRHAITAGELLIAAKAQMPHGQWLSWLREHCAISERTEQFYMRVAKNRAEIEAEISEDAADVTLALSSDARRLFRFVKELGALDDPDETLQACLAANGIVDENYNPFAGRTEQFKQDWQAFLAEHGGKSSAEARSEAEAVAKRFEQDMAAGRLNSLRRPSRKRTRAA